MTFWEREVEEEERARGVYMYTYTYVCEFGHLACHGVCA